jgi:hypothetical protein
MVNKYLSNLEAQNCPTEAKSLKFKAMKSRVVGPGGLEPPTRPL